MVKKIEIEVTGDTRNLERALKSSQKQASSWEKGLSAAAKGGAVALAGLGVAAVYSVKSASNLEEQINKTAVVFRGSEKAIHAWSQTTAGAFGISQRAALEAAGTFGNMLVPMGIARDKAGDMSKVFVELAADMASFNNASPEETLDALRAGLAGESEPLRRFGVFLNEARIKQEAVSKGLIKTAKSDLPAAAKAQAIYSLVLKDTTDAQGDFGRTSDSLANQQRILRAELEDTAAQLGMALIPAATGAASALLDLVNWTKQNEEAAKAMAIAIGVVSAGLIVANASLKIYTSATLTAIGATKGLRLAMAATPWGLAAVAAAGLVAWLISQREKTSDAERATRDLSDALRDYNTAVEEGKSSRVDFEAAQLRLERAELGVQQAILNRKRVDKDAKSTSLERREADLSVAEAMNQRAQAEKGVADASDKVWEANVKNTKASGDLSLKSADLARVYREKLAKATERVVFNQQTLTFETHRGSASLDAAQKNAREYASRLRSVADAAEKTNPKLANTARLAADLAVAWGRVVSLPAAREFVARFRVITTVETNRIFGGPKAAGGPVSKGRAYIVGEKRPEVFVPNESGRIIPRVSSAPSSGGSGASGPGQFALIYAGPDFISYLRNEAARWERTNGKAAFG